MTTFLVERANETSPGLHPQSLEEAMRTVEPGVVLVPPWLMQSVIGFDQGHGRSSFAVHHCKVYGISRERLTQMAEKKGLDLPAGLPAAETLVLLAKPEIEWLDARPKERVLQYYWRLLFHRRVALEARRKLPATPADRAAVEARIERIGRTAFSEARFVLQREHYLAADASVVDGYVEFAALYLELHRFHPELLPVYFPAIANAPEVLATLTADVDADEILRQTRLPGAIEPQSGAAPGEHHAPTAPTETPSRPHASKSDAAALLAQAEQTASTGNNVRAAILRQSCTPLTPGETVAPAAQKDLNLLVDRLAAALQLNDTAAGKWRACLGHVLALAGDGWWNQEARMLYDLQKACVNYEREIYSVNVLQWLMERGRRAFRRPQPNQRIALICKSLRSALGRIHRSRLPAAQREELTELLHDAQHHTEKRLCEALRPAVAQSLKAGNLIPRNTAERVAENKVVDELLDGLAHRGFITLSNLRDAIANNQLKFDDIQGPGQFIKGDQLFNIDRRLSQSLDGVYHRGEAYLRFFQRASSLFFATSIGRFITLIFLMPLLGSYIIIAGLDHTIFELARIVIDKLSGWELPHLEPLANFLHHKHPLSTGEVIVGNVTFAVLAVIVLGVVNWPPCRKVVWRALAWFCRSVGFVFYTAPKWVIDLPPVQAVLTSRAARLVMRYVLEPGFFAVITWLLVRRHALPSTQWIVFSSVFVFMNLLLNNPIGRAVEQAVAHWFRTMWARVTSDFLANLFNGILHFFARRMEDFDRMLYAVDEWLRFRDGQPRSALYVKATLGIFWFYIAYVSRFAVNLLIEPQINPIKHFPVVTVSHKIILPQVHLVQGMLPARVKGLAFPILFVIPGIFGFLAWELRSNWMLYRANRAKRLKPVMVGSHGESMARLLRPGFHSGTVPKIFARLRKALRHADERRDAAAAETALLNHHEALDHVGEAVGHFIERELLALLNDHPLWRSTPVALNGVTLHATRITVELVCPVSAASMRIFFEQRGGWILAGTDHPTGAANISFEQGQFLAAALLGLYKLAGVDIVKEQLESVFAPKPIAFDLSENEITIWPDRQFDHPQVFNLREQAADQPPAQPGQVDVQKLLFRPVAIDWEQWVAIWEPSPTGPAAIPATFPTTCVLSPEAVERARLGSV